MSTPESPQVAAIRARYQSNLMEKAKLLATRSDAIRKAQSEQVLQQARQDLREDLHKLAGSSGMYGYNDISALCRKAMSDVDDNDAGELDKCMAELQDVIRQHA